MVFQVFVRNFERFCNYRQKFREVLPFLRASDSPTPLLQGGFVECISIHMIFRFVFAFLETLKHHLLILLFWSPNLILISILKNCKTIHLKRGGKRLEELVHSNFLHFGPRMFFKLEIFRISSELLMPSTKNFRANICLFYIFSFLETFNVTWLLTFFQNRKDCLKVMPPLYNGKWQRHEKESILWHLRVIDWVRNNSTKR